MQNEELALGAFFIRKSDSVCISETPIFLLASKFLQTPFDRHSCPLIAQLRLLYCRFYHIFISLLHLIFCFQHDIAHARYLENVYFSSLSLYLSSLSSASLLSTSHFLGSSFFSVCS